MGGARRRAPWGACLTSQLYSRFQGCFILLHVLQVAGECARQREEDRAAVESKAASTLSTAESRPNAYIPEHLGIPKPYGGFAPFKPTDAGSTMRHIRNPQPKEIVI